MGREAVLQVGVRMLYITAGLSIGMCAASASGYAQLPTQTVTPAPGDSPASRFYGGVEYLNWWVKGSPLPVPLLTTGPFTEPTRGGFIRNSDVTILYGAPLAPAVGGNDTQSFRPFSGSRVTLGYWLDESRRYAIEASGFLLERGSAGYEMHGDANGSPAMRIPVYNSVPYASGGVGMIVGPTEDGVPVSLPGDLTGGTAFKNTLQLWGAQATAVVNVYRDSSWEVSGLAGGRYLSLSEGFNLNLNITGFVNTPFAGETGSASDQFQTRNQFYGATVGMRGRYRVGPLSAELTGTLSMGFTNESLDISGSYQEANTPVVTPTRGVAAGLRTVTTGPNGIFAQPSNEGRSSGNRFAVVPEIGIKLGYDVTPAARLTVGYNFLYISSVLRPGDQIDRNFSKGLPFQQDPSSTTGPTRRFKSTDFYAQGLTVGVEFHF